MKKWLIGMLDSLIVRAVRKTTDLETEIVKVVSAQRSNGGKNYGMTAYWIVNGIEQSFHDAFSVFEIEYTIDCLVRDGKIEFNYNGLYVIPEKGFSRTKVKITNA
jgi:hypothetical protein